MLQRKKTVLQWTEEDKNKSSFCWHEQIHVHKETDIVRVPEKNRDEKQPLKATEGKSSAETSQLIGCFMPTHPVRLYQGDWNFIN